MLEKHCEKVFISCNKKQGDSIDDFYNFIIDKPNYTGIGPMASLLSAFDTYNDVSFLVIGCDYPFITENDIVTLIKKRTQYNEAVCFFDDKNLIEQPLLAIYENQILNQLTKKFELKQYGLKSFLKNIKTEKIIPNQEDKLLSIDTIEQYNWAFEKINSTNNNL